MIVMTPGVGDGRVLLTSSGGRGGGEARGAAKHPTVHRTAPHDGESSTPNATAGRLRNPVPRVALGRPHLSTVAVQLLASI